MLLIITNYFTSYKRDYLATQLPICRAEALDLYSNNDDDLDIYIEDNEEDNLDELDRYFEERRANR